MCGKTLYIATVLFFVSTVAHAQAGSNEIITAGSVIGEVFPHFTHTAASSNGNSKVSSRLIAKANTVYKGESFQPVDSSIYIYYSNRGGTPDLNEPNKDSHIMFDESIVYDFNTTLNVYENQLRRTQSFDVDNRVVDLIYQEWRLSTMSWNNNERYEYIYKDGKMIKSLLSQWVGLLWLNTNTSNIDYSGSNVTKVSSHTYNIQFSYASNNLVQMEHRTMNSSGVMELSQRRSYKYGASNVEVTEYVLEEYDANTNTWYNSRKWEYAYNSNQQQRTTTEYFWDGGWRPKYQTYYTYNTSGNIVLKIIRAWSPSKGKFDNHKKEEWQYNTHDQPIEIKSYTWDNVGYKHLEGDKYIKYYYENYNPDNISIVKSESDINVYPIPANNTLNISADLHNTKQPVEISLTDMSGKVVYNTQKQASNLKHTISLSNLPSGNYVLKLTGDKDNITKQVMVAH